MRISYQWLNEYVDLSGVTPEELAESLTRAGLEVEQIIKPGEGIKNVVVGYIEACGPHPQADKLSLCQVNLGEGEPVQIVCGADNVAQGQHVPVAKVGATLPGGIKIKRVKLRGEESFGMICSAQELGMDEHFIPDEYKDGIMVLPPDAQVGDDALTYLGLNDAILELDLTPNRSDCLSMIGVAYEVAAILERDLKLPPLSAGTAEQDSSGGSSAAKTISVKVTSTEDCPYYEAHAIQGVKIGSSPLWMQNRLRAAGMRPINNVVDVTNYVMLEYGTPLHAFDAKMVAEREIIVRKAQAGESVETLDGQTRSLKEEMLVITDPEKVIAIAGVMGAANSEVTSETTDIILEAAVFDGISIRRTSKTLDLRSEASLRFEKGVDPARVSAAGARAAQLLAELAGGTITEKAASGPVVASEERRVSLPLVKLNQVLGTRLETSEVTRIFERLQFEYENKGHEIVVEIPSRRPDLAIEEDLIEEVARLHGYDNIPTTLPRGVTTPGSRTKRQQLRERITNFLRSAGLDQVITYSLTGKEQAAWGSWFEEGVHPISLAMPMSQERTHLRTTLIPNLLEVALYNKNRQQNHLHFFELGHTFLTQETSLTQLPEEREVVAGLISGLWQEHAWQKVEVPADFFVVKGIVDGLLTHLGIASAEYRPIQREQYHPGRTAELVVQGERLGIIGQLHPRMAREMELSEVYLFELDVERLFSHLPGLLSYEPLPKYPGVDRDLAVVVSEEITADKLVATIIEAGAPLLKETNLFDVYTGSNIGEGKKSLAFSLTYRHPERTLTDAEVDEIHGRIVKALAENWGAMLR